MSDRDRKQQRAAALDRWVRGHEPLLIEAFWFLAVAASIVINVWALGQELDQRQRRTHARRRVRRLGAVLAAVVTPRYTGKRLRKLRKQDRCWDPPTASRRAVPHPSADAPGAALGYCKGTS